MRTIPEFPTFETVDVAHREAVEAFTHAHEPYSDFNFTSLWAWDTSGERMVSQLNGNLVVRFTDYSTNEPFLSFLGTNETEHTARTLIDYCKANGLPTTLKLMPEVSTRGMRPSVLKIEEDRDNFDYVYSVSELSAMRGSKYETKRNLIHRFVRSNPNAVFEVRNLNDVSNQQNLLSLLDVWEKEKIAHKKEYEVEHERIAIQRLCETSISHPLILSGVFVNEEMLAFSIEEALSMDYGISHFWKASSSYAGLYDFLMQGKAKHLESLGVALLDYEQDLGLVGLRAAKNSFRPIQFLKKYSVSLL